MNMHPTAMDRLDGDPDFIVPPEDQVINIGPFFNVIECKIRLLMIKNATA
jgi:hypothetical protein